MTRVLITGQQWVSKEFCKLYYESKIRADFAAGKRFGIGGADGVDKYGQELLIELCTDADRKRDIASDHPESSFKRVTVYMKGERDGRLDKNFFLKNGYESFPDRDMDLGWDCDEVIFCPARFESGVTGALLPWLIVTRKALRRQEAADGRTLVTISRAELVVECLKICDALRDACEPYSDEIANPVKAIYAAHYH